MNIRILIYIVITLVATGLFLFIPNLNLGSAHPHPISLYEELLQSNNWLAVLGRLFFLAGVIFVGLIFLFGVKKK